MQLYMFVDMFVDMYLTLFDMQKILCIVLLESPISLIHSAYEVFDISF